MRSFYLLIIGIFFISLKVYCQISTSIQKLGFKEPISNVFTDHSTDKVIYTFNFENESGLYFNTGNKILFENNETVQDFNYGHIITVENLDPKTEETIVRLYSISENELRNNCSLTINTDYLHAVIINEERVVIKKFGEGTADFSIELYDYVGNLIEDSKILPKFGLSFMVNSKDYFYYYAASDADYNEESPQKCLLYKVDSRNASILNVKEIETTGRSELHDGGNVILLKTFDNIVAYDNNFNKLWQINDVIGYDEICLIQDRNLIAVPTKNSIFIINSLDGKINKIIDNSSFLLPGQKSLNVKKAIPLDLHYSSNIIMVLLYIEINVTEERNIAFYDILNSDVEIARFNEKFSNALLTNSNGIWKLYTEKFSANFNLNK